jgi:RTX calcium-binding nonapeptide repeat (4 copies)/Calx-beta domain
MPFNIKLDFTTFNSVLNSDQQNAVIRAAQDWEVLLANNEFDDIPLGTSIRYINPNTGQPETTTLTSQNGGPIDDVLIYVGGRQIPPLTPTSGPNIAKADLLGDNVLNNPNIDNDYLSARMRGIKFQPSVGSLSFNPNPAQIQFWSLTASNPSNTSPAANEYDLYTVAKHEIGHILGFFIYDGVVLPPNSAFEQLHSGSSGNRVFNGINAKSVSSLAAGVPLDPGGGFLPDHFALGTTSTLVQTTTLPVGSTTTVLMVPQYLPGTGIPTPPGSSPYLPGDALPEKGITKLDLAVLADSGYQVDGQGFTNLDLANPIVTNPNITSGFMVAGTPSGDTIAGDVGNDTLAGGPGNDSINGGVGIDYMYGGDGADTLVGGNGDDTLNDTLIGGRGNDRIDGVLGNDYVVGGDGNDILIGGAGDDTIIGGPGNDTVSGGTGRNNLRSFDLIAANPTEVDTLFHATSSLSNRFVLTENDLNGYKNGGDLDYADIQLFAAGLDVLVVANTANIGRVVVGGDTYVYDNSSNPRELLAIVRGITTATDVRLTSAVNPVVTSINRAAANPTNAANLPFTVIFSESVTGVDPSDFVLTSTGAITGATITNVSGSGNTYTVTASTGSGVGDTRLDLIDDDSIIDIDSAPLGGLGAGNANFTSGETYTVQPPPPTVQILIATAPSGDVSEAATTAITVTATASAPVTGDQTVSVALSGSATAGDFTGTIPAQITIPNGQTSGSFTVNVNDDAIVEAIETATFTISNPSSGIALGATTTGSVNILDNDANLAIAADSSATATEGNSGTKAFTFTVTRSGNISGSSTANWAVTGTGVNPADATDFGGTLPTGTVSFAANEITKAITVNVSGDSDVEPDENFTVTLANPSGAAITTANATGTIQNDDTLPTIAIAADSSATATEGNSGTKAFTFTVTRSGDTSGSSTSDWTVAGSGANPANATDFGGTLPTGTVSFAANETTKAITVNVSGDSDVEPDENFTVTLANPSGAAIATATATGTIQNDDTLPLPNIAIAADPSATATEGNSGTKAFTFTVTRTGSTSSSSTADWTVTSTGANPANATDFGGTLPTGTVNFAPNETSKTITVNVSGDTAVEPDENFTVTLSNPSGAAITNATATGTIQNDDAGLAIAATNGTQTEGNSGTKAFTFTVTRSGNTSGASTANWTVAGTGANPANAADFGATLPTGTVSFAANETTKTITVNVNGDTVVEPDENFTVTLANPTGAAIITATSTGTIQNDDTNLAIAADPTAIQSEGNSSATAFTFTVTRNGATTSSTSASWAVTGGTTNPANAADFVGNALPKGTVSFATGETSKTVTVNVNGDTQFEPGENFVVTLSAPTGGATITTATAAGTIQNDDAVNLAIAPTNAVQDEGNTATKPFTFTVTRSGDTTGSTSVKWAVAGSGTSPANATDFGTALPSGTLNFTAGQTSQIITVNVKGDTALELDEDFTVTLADPTPGTTLTTASAAGTIRNDDVNLAIVADPSAIQPEGNSGATSFTFTITRNGVTTGSTNVNWAVTGGTTNPANAADFVGNALPKGTVSFATGETSKTVTVNVNGDTQFEPGENFVVTLSAPTGGATIATATATGTIQNDDSVNLAIAPTNAVQDEGNTGAKPIHFYRNPQR